MGHVALFLVSIHDYRRRRVRCNVYEFPKSKDESSIDTRQRHEKRDDICQSDNAAKRDSTGVNKTTKTIQKHCIHSLAVCTQRDALPCTFLWSKSSLNANNGALSVECYRRAIGFIPFIRSDRISSLSLLFREKRITDASEKEKRLIRKDRHTGEWNTYYISWLLDLGCRQSKADSITIELQWQCVDSHCAVHGENESMGH